MSECRICFGSESGEILSPCKCKGSIQHVHQKCLINWLKNKYSGTYQQILKGSASGNTGLQCELCKYEYKGSVKYIRLKKIIKILRKSHKTYYVLLNIPIIIYLAYKCNYLFRRIFQKIYTQVIGGNSQNRWALKMWQWIKVYIGIVAQLFPLSVCGFTLPMIMINTMKMFLKLITEFRMVQIENFMY
ncbi:hypothetical protein SteCoe_21783 [Stentor coeruleus]|uniref:RING-CH-type domain-containing protein n=1 Tax=Stentor coeruleus TaxID=5963 RepID=A0A1R2BNZ0_9CILI|nr:hypothetical protein SteCoe_21783 [Stentor coeruleus]